MTRPTKSTPAPPRDHSATDVLFAALAGLCPAAFRLGILLDRIEVRP